MEWPSLLFKRSDSPRHPQASAFRALSAIPKFRFRYGHEPTEVIAKGKKLLAVWIQRQARVAALEDAFVFAALFIAIGIFPALLIRKATLPEQVRPIGVPE